jgi:hemolysin activation/secretion protein
MCDAKNHGHTPRFKMNVVCTALLAWGLSQVATAQTADVSPAVEAAASKVNVNEYLVRGNTVLTALEIEDAVTPFLGPERTLKDVEAARDALLAQYQKKGFQSVYVDLPEQETNNGVVLLQVTETRVGRVRVVGANYSSPVDVREQVTAIQEGTVPDFNKAQTELMALNRTAKRQVMPLVKQGAIPGTMDVDLKVDDSSPWRGSLGLNNDRSSGTSPLRLSASIGHDNLWQMGHSASISFYGTPQDYTNSNSWSGSYKAPLQNSNWTLEVSGYRSNSNVTTIGRMNVLGKGHSIGMKASYAMPNTGSWWHTLSAGVDLKSNEEEIRANLANSGEKTPLRYAPLNFGYSGFAQYDNYYQSIDVNLVAGTSSFFGYGSTPLEFWAKRYESRPSFVVGKLDTSGAYTFGNGMQLYGRFSAQMTDSPLISGEQITAGGMYTVRGYSQAEIAGDYGGMGSLEFRTKNYNYAWLQNLRFYTFAEAAKLNIHEALQEQNVTAWIASVGLGSSFNLGNYVTGRVDLGYPLKKGVNTKRHSPLVNFSLNASY